MGPPARRLGVARRCSPHKDVITLCGTQLPLQDPTFHYLGHLMAHPVWEQKARDDFIGTMCADLDRYKCLTMNAFKRVQLFNAILLPRSNYGSLILPNDSLFQATDSMCLRFLLMAEAVELNTTNVHISHYTLHATSLLPIGLAPNVSDPQGTIRHHGAKHTRCLPELRGMSHMLPSQAVPIHNCLAILIELGPHTALQVDLAPQPAEGPNSFDRETSDNRIPLLTRKPLHTPLHGSTPLPRQPLGGHCAIWISPRHHIRYTIHFGLVPLLGAHDQGHHVEGSFGHCTSRGSQLDPAVSTACTLLLEYKDVLSGYVTFD